MDTKDEINATTVSSTRKRVFSALLFIFLIIVVLFVAFMVYIKSQDIDLETVTFAQITEQIISEFTVAEEEEPVQIEIDYNQNIDKLISANNEYIIKCTDVSIIGTDKKGNQKWEVPFSADKLLLRTAGHYVAAANQEGRDLLLIKQDEILWSKKTDNPIISVGINKDGYLAVVTDPSDYRSRLTLYDPEGIEIFTYNIVNRYVISADIYKDMNIIVINSLDADGIRPVSNIEFVDFYGNFISAVTVQEDAIFPFVHLFDEGTACAVGRDRMVFYNDKKEVAKVVKHDTIYSSITVDGRYLVLAVKNGGGNSTLKSGKSEILLYSDRGEMYSSNVITGDVVNLRSIDDITGINTGREVLFINASGQLIDSFTAGADIRDFYFFNKAETVIITNEKIIVYRMQNSGERT